MIPPSIVVLHSGQGLALAEYLFRVIVQLLGLIGIGVIVYWWVSPTGIVSTVSAISDSSK